MHSAKFLVLQLISSPELISPSRTNFEGKLQPVMMPSSELDPSFRPYIPSDGDDVSIYSQRTTHVGVGNRHSVRITSFLILPKLMVKQIVPHPTSACPTEIRPRRHQGDASWSWLAIFACSLSYVTESAGPIERRHYHSSAESLALTAQSMYLDAGDYTRQLLRRSSHSFETIANLSHFDSSSGRLVSLSSQ